MKRRSRKEIQPFSFTLTAHRDDDPSQTLQLEIHVTKEIIAEALRRGLNSDQVLALAVEQALRAIEAKKVLQ